MNNNVETHERLVKAWKNAPEGVKARVVRVFGYSWQNIDAIIKNGRKDESIMLSLIQAIKQASADVLSETKNKNDIVQKV